MKPNLAGQQFGDTTYTKVFVGGLAWETQKDTMKQYFEQFGEILEAAVISDKNTGRSKGYGFVTFSEPDAATRACADPSPVIYGRRANCNIASIGIKRSTPQHGGCKGFMVTKSFQEDLQGGMINAFSSTAAFPHYAIHQGIPYHAYSYSSYSPDYPYPTTYYSLYGGGVAQYPLYEGTDATNGMVNGTNSSFYPYFQFVNGQSGYGVQYPQLIHHSVMSSTAGITGFALQQSGIHTPFSSTPSFTPLQISGMIMALPMPSPPTPAAKHYKLIAPTSFSSTAAVSAINPWPNHG